MMGSITGWAEGSVTHEAHRQRQELPRAHAVQVCEGSGCCEVMSRGTDWAVGFWANGEL